MSSVRVNSEVGEQLLSWEDTFIIILLPAWDKQDDGVPTCLPHSPGHPAFLNFISFGGVGGGEEQPISQSCGKNEMKQGIQNYK